MSEIKDINGLPFKVGCVFEMVGEKREVLKIYRDGAITAKCDEPSSTVWWAASLLYWNNARILHYRELAPDKNGKMLCEGDTVLDCGEKYLVIAYLNGFCVLQEPSDENMWWAKPDKLTFVSRPTDVPNEAAKKKAELLAKADELIAKANEMVNESRELKEKAEEM